MEKIKIQRHTAHRAQTSKRLSKDILKISLRPKDVPRMSIGYRVLSGWFTLPYIPRISDNYIDLDTKVSYFSLNKLGNIIKGHKDTLLILKTKNDL